AARTVARKRGLSGDLVSAWAQRIQAAEKQPDSLFYPYANVLETMRPDEAQSFDAAWRETKHALTPAAESPAAGPHLERGDVIFEEFETEGYPNWKVAGQAFGDGPVHRLAPNEALRDYLGQGV